ncbi:MAG TPA: hypothetical protein VKX41_16385 [Alloacidobacterium sp.]|nr:hypothetical protein [Alloacidobacterium sp.]
MTQLQIQPAAVRTVVRLFSPCRFVIRFIVSAVSTLAGLVSFSLVGPTLCRIAAVDPTLEAFYGVLVVVWFGSLGRMWFLTFRDRNRQ